MDWVKVAVRYWADPKVATLPDADTELMFVRSVTSDHAKQTGGFIPESALPELARRRRYAACVDSLVTSGLWLRVDGGYRITRWADWQDGLDAIEKRRAADRERKRAKRAAERELSRATPQVVRGLSADSPADVRALERGEKDLKGGSAKGDRSARAREKEPPRKCAKHTSTADPPRCGGCADARKAHERWHAEKARRLAAAAKCAAHPDQLAANCSWCAAETKGVA